MNRAALCVLMVLAGLLGGCAAKVYPVRDDHDHTPGPPLMPTPAHHSDTEGG